MGFCLRGCLCPMGHITNRCRRDHHRVFGLGRIGKDRLLRRGWRLGLEFFLDRLDRFIQRFSSLGFLFNHLGGNLFGRRFFNDRLPDFPLNFRFKAGEWAGLAFCLWLCTSGTQ